MPTSIECPSCNRKLKVPDNLLGKKVKCPTCGNAFTAAEEPPPPIEDEEEPPPPPDDDLDEMPEEEEAPRKKKKKKKGRSSEYLAPHRGTLVLILGIIALAGNVVVPGCAIVGPVAWILGNNDLKEMREGRMDPSGESHTNIGRILGMIATILLILGAVTTCGFFILWLVLAGAIVGGAAGGLHVVTP
jgi:predicted Zn finger-like uncharacterized protein